MQEKKPNLPFVAVDLFCGGGGLTEGLKQAGFFVCAGVEVDREAAGVYSDNNPQARTFLCDIKKLTAKKLLESSPTKTIDLIAACPPCQGFSSLTYRYKREDHRNQLIFEFVRIVKEAMPKTIVMENVPGLASGRGKCLFTQAKGLLEDLGYSIQFKIVDVANYGVPQHRRRLVLLGALGKGVSVPEGGYGKGKKDWNTVLGTIKNLPTPSIFSSKVQRGDLGSTWHVIRNISKVNIERLKTIKEGGDRFQIPDSLRPACHKGKDKGFQNVYGRMRWNEPSPTITGGFTTLSKGRFGHPVENRTISVLEGALLQTFPEDYIFRTNNLDTTCKIIGNALPPLFAKEMAGECLRILQEEKNELQS